MAGCNDLNWKEQCLSRGLRDLGFGVRATSGDNWKGRGLGKIPILISPDTNKQVLLAAVVTPG